MQWQKKLRAGTSLTPQNLSTMSDHDAGATAPSVIEIPFATGNVYLINGRDKAVLVDTLFPGYGSAILKRLRQKRIDVSRISLILLTHGHVDHFGNALYLRRQTRAPTAIHERDADGPRRGRSVRLYSRNYGEKAAAFFARMLRAPAFEPDVVLKGEKGDLADYGVEACWVRTPGHSEGSVSVVIPGKAAIVGDLVVGRFGFSNRPAFPMWVKDGQLVKDSVKKLLDYKPPVFLCGHSGPLKAADVARVFLGG
ncbi:MAG: MBL fold metallo-hydrolase [Chloroflexi bacterium]|nr:MBL fold metallo-hydrolase [Chloroflexota bacterium]